MITIMEELMKIERNGKSLSHMRSHPKRNKKQERTFDEF